MIRFLLIVATGVLMSNWAHAKPKLKCKLAEQVVRKGKCVYVDKKSKKSKKSKVGRVILKSKPKGQLHRKCYGNNTCNAELTCVKKHCRKPGALWEPCRANKTCNAGLTCRKGKKCVPVPEGQMGGPCYGNNTCNAPFKCWQRRCITAGEHANRMRDKQKRQADKNRVVKIRQVGSRLVAKLASLRYTARSKQVTDKGSWWGSVDRATPCRLTFNAKLDEDTRSGPERGDYSTTKVSGTVDFASPRTVVKRYGSRWVGIRFYGFYVGHPSRPFNFRNKGYHRVSGGKFKDGSREVGLSIRGTSKSSGHEALRLAQELKRLCLAK